jgi:hypothetical protein
MQPKKSLLLIVLFSLSFIFMGCGSSGESPSTNLPQLKIFVTSASGNGNLSTWADAGGNTGVAAGDAVCQAVAERAGLSGTFRAWLSDSTTDAYCHIQGLTGKKADNCGQATLPTDAGPWFRMGDAHPFSDTIDKLVNDGQVFVPVYYDENGTKVTDGYFTGTSEGGTVMSGYHCADWTSSSSSDNVMLGNPLGTTQRWSQLTTSTCNGSRRLLCMQTGTGRALSAITAPTGSKKVFATATSYSGNLGGLSGADNICQTRASALGLTNADKFKAWLSDEANDASDRLTSDGPWYRLDGVKVADSKADLTDGEIFTSINYTGTSYIGTAVWTGTTQAGLRNSPYCANWTSNLSGDSGTFGSSTLINSWWTQWPGTWNCNSNYVIYCFEDQ